METKIVYHDKDGVKRTSIADTANPERLVVQTQVQMDGVLESVKRARESVKAGSTNKHLAVVPMTVMERSIHENWDEGDWKKWLNDPDNAHLRVWRGRV